MSSASDLAVLQRALKQRLLTAQQLATILESVEPGVSLSGFLVSQGFLSAEQCRHLEAGSASRPGHGRAAGEDRTWNLPHTGPVPRDTEEQTTWTESQSVSLPQASCGDGTVALTDASGAEAAALSDATAFVVPDSLADDGTEAEFARRSPQPDAGTVVFSEHGDADATSAPDDATGSLPPDSLAEGANKAGFVPRSPQLDTGTVLLPDQTDADAKSAQGDSTSCRLPNSVAEGATEAEFGQRPPAAETGTMVFHERTDVNAVQDSQVPDTIDSLPEPSQPPLDVFTLRDSFQGPLPPLPLPAHAPQKQACDAQQTIDSLSGPVERRSSAPETRRLPSRPLFEGKQRYLVHKELARGGLGRVLLGHDQYIARDVAIKELLPHVKPSDEAVNRFLEEAQVTGQLQHPGIVPIYELGLKSDGQPYYSMKLLSGQTFSRAIKNYHAMKADDPGRAMVFDQLLRTFVSVCDTVAYAHSRGVVHRDLKPANIMLGDFGEAVVVDWGIAKVGAADRAEARASKAPADARATDSPSSSGTISTSFRDDASRTMAGQILGTPAYMSPEQARGDTDLDSRTDVYALGIILFEILVGKTPFAGRNVKEILSQVKKGGIVPPRQLQPATPAALSAIVMKAVAPRREDRYASVRDLEDDVKRYLAGEAVSVYPLPWWERSWRWVKKHPTLTTTVAVGVCLLALALGAWNWWENRRIARVREESGQMLRAGQDALLQDQFETAQQELTTALALTRQEGTLADLSAEAERLLEEARARKVAAGRLERTRQAFGQFLKRRDDALYHGTLFTGLDTEENLQQCEQAARDALRLLDKLSDPADADVAGSLLTADERLILTMARKELTLILAEAQAMPLPGDTAEKQAARCRQALFTLEKASGLQPPLRAYHLRQGKYLEILAGVSKEAERESYLRQAALQRQQAEKLAPAAALDLFFLGDEQFRQGNFQQAIEYFDRALRLEPERFWAQYFVAACYLRENNPARALGYLTACVTQRPHFSWAFLLRGTAYGELGEFSAAEADFQRARELKVLPYALLINRGVMRLRQEKLALAISDFLEARQLKPNSYEAYFNLGRAYHDQKKWKEALSQLNEAVQRAPHLSQPLRLRAQVYLALNEADKALADLAMAIKQDAPGSKLVAEDHYERGRILHKKKLYEAALQAYDAAQKLQPDRVELHRLRADVLLALGRNKEAQQALDEFLDRPKKVDPDAYRQRGFERARAGNHGGALADWTRALEMEPTSALTLGRRGWAWLNHATKLALGDFDDALKLDPASADLHTGRGYARVLLGKHAEAVQDAEKAVLLAAKASDPREKIAAPFNAACIYAQAIAKLGFGADFPGRDEKKAKYLARAFELLDQTLAALPAQARPAFLREAVTDPGLEPIRHLKEFDDFLRKRSAP